MRQRHLGSGDFFHHAAHRVGRGRAMRPMLLRRPRHCRQQAAQAGLGVDQELCRGHHLLPRLQPALHHELVADLCPQLHLHGVEFARAIDHIGQGALAGADDGLAGNQQRRLLAALERDLAGHAGLQALAGVGQLQPHAHRARVAVGLRQDAHDARPQHLAGKRRQAHLGLLPQLQRAALRLGYGGLDPDGGQAIHARQAGASGNGHALAHHEFGHQAALGRAYGVDAPGLARALHLGHQGLRHAQQQQPLPGGRRQRLVLERTHRQELALRRHPFGQQQVRQRRAGTDHVARRARIDPLHEAR